MAKTNCEECAYLIYDEEFDSYECEFIFDEDDLAQEAVYRDHYVCPHFQYQDEYRIVKKQM